MTTAWLCLLTQTWAAILNFSFIDLISAPFCTCVYVLPQVAIRAQIQYIAIMSRPSTSKENGIFSARRQREVSSIVYMLIESR